MRTLEEIQRMSRDEKIASLRGITPDGIIRALLAYLPETFLSDREKLHAAIQKLRRKEEYWELLKDFEPVPGAVFEYSALLERVLKRLQEARMLTTQSPDLTVFQVSAETRGVIALEILRKFSATQQNNLKKIAGVLTEELKVL